ncbi:MAG: phosphoribosylglycinamide formyltransferase-1 [Planctomycetota bacterium]|jgi:phosphoribosylglycinamide formyltransferase-1
MSDRRVCILLSGSGRSLENLLRHIEAKKLNCEINGVIASRRGIRGIEVAREAGIPVEVIRRRDYETLESFSDANTKAIEKMEPNLVVMAGYLSFYHLPESLKGKVINIHPSLLPLFGGEGYYGHHVHKAVLESGMRVTGCTVHFVDNIYDNGPFVLQLPVPVKPNDTIDDLASRVFETECRALPQAISWILNGSARFDSGQVHFKSDATIW